MSKFISAAGFPIILISGILGQKIAARLWTKVFGREPPDTAQEHVRWPQLIPAAIVEGTVYKLARMLVDRGPRLAVAKSTGSWPGQVGQGE